ncbi:GNAT family N-acetyltransferase [Demequina capsici]|uniref:GNAT family N-acetyltransferase n=1 Tax=Demequina capsici TaxID=3075620 RepID=A0AA96FD11_9MICO|nr:GNAT family N-acetyltransferase [Demequina sp. PMTSA13]WNM27623.1 GNAT family N-acetyltransferase [Demequina sp. PMTSA13]
MITIREVEPDDPEALALWDEQQQELAERYDAPDLELETRFSSLLVSLVGYSDDEAVATVVLRWSPHHEDGAVEVKRLYVKPDHRGHGHSRALMGVAESFARRAGATRLVLETGDQQPEALSLYDSIGYTRIAGYGEWKDDEGTLCYGRTLPTRLLIVNGTIGAGKTAVAAGVLDALGDRGARVAFLDADAVCQAAPARESDPYHQELMFAAMSRLAPLYRQRGYGCVVVARVVEAPEDRARWSLAFASEVGAPEVVVARVTAPLDERRARIDVREPEGRWRDWAHARTVELDDVLETQALDDVVVENSGRSARDTAEELLAEIGW